MTAAVRMRYRLWYVDVKCGDNRIIDVLGPFDTATLATTAARGTGFKVIL